MLVTKRDGFGQLGALDRRHVSAPDLAGRWDGDRADQYRLVAGQCEGGHDGAGQLCVGVRAAGTTTVPLLAAKDREALGSGDVCSPLMAFVVLQGLFELVFEDDDPAGGF
jgi:hypothetical protein